MSTNETKVRLHDKFRTFVFKREEKKLKSISKSNEYHDHALSDSEKSNSSCRSDKNEIEPSSDQNSNQHPLSDSEDETRALKSQPSDSVNSHSVIMSDSSDNEKNEPPRSYSRIKTFAEKKQQPSMPSNNKSREFSSQKRPAESTRKKGRPKKRQKKATSDDDTTEDEDRGGYHGKELIYDSDELEDGVTNIMTSSQKKVFNFINNATEYELLLVSGCTPTRAATIISLRPFKGLKDWVIKFQNVKGNFGNFLNQAHELLLMRQTVSSLMNKCLNIAIKTQNAIEIGQMKISKQPSILTPNMQLKAYQIVGLNWLCVMHQQNLSGILSDEMGLGKTIQVIAFLGYLKENNESLHPHLVICPTSTLDNWAIEFAKWCPSLNVVIYHGPPEDRRALRTHWFNSAFQNIDVILTTYSTATVNYEDKKMLRIIPIHYVVFDEAHMLKNMNSQRYMNLFRINAKQRVLLTGTPLQNNLLELMSLLNFVMPGMFFSKIDYIKAFFSKNSKVPEDKLSDFEKTQIDLAKRIMKPFVLRRLKKDVLKDLPTKTSEVIKCPMTPLQKKKYDEILEEIKESAKNPDSHWSWMSSFTTLRRMANHPLTLRYHYTDETLHKMANSLWTDEFYKKPSMKEHIVEDLSFMSDFELHNLCKKYTSISHLKLNEELVFECGKIKMLDSLLPRLKEEGHRVIIFSQFVFVLDILGIYLAKRNYNYTRLDGSIRSYERQDLIDGFNDDSDVFVFLLSTKAGGVGINLTSADTVIIHDIDFNPYNDKQAEDRCHRLGQTRPVKIIRFISEGTVEEAIHTQAENKLTLEQEITEADDEEEKKNVELLLKESLGLLH